MKSFKMEIAGAVICVEPLFESTMEYCRPYLTDKDSDFAVRIKDDDLLYEQMLLEHEAVKEGLKIRKFKEPFLERSTIQRRVADFLIERDTLMMHGSTVSVDNRAYLFTAPCGTGKSTHTRLWRECFGDRAVMVNDDKPLLKIAPSGVYAYGSPWSGKHGLAMNICVPLKGICLIHRGSKNTIYPALPRNLVGVLYDQVYIPTDKRLSTKVFPLIDALIENVSLWEMYCNKNLDAAEVAYSAMKDC